MNEEQYYKEELDRILTETSDIALATAADDMPNVRIMNCCCAGKNKGMLYLLTDNGSIKTKEFAANNRVAFTSIPKEGMACVRSNNAVVYRCETPIDELADLFRQQIYQFDKTRKLKGDKMCIYEVHIKEAQVFVDFKHRGIVKY